MGKYHLAFSYLQIVATALLWILVPGCGFFYSGMGTSTNSLVLFMTSFWSIAIVSVQWYVIGYSLSFSSTSGPFIGDFRNAFLVGVYDGVFSTEVKEIPELAFCFYQGVTATVGPALILGVIAERGRLLPALVFTLLWTTFVYDPIASWSLNPRGWSARLGRKAQQLSLALYTVHLFRLPHY
jgi:Amt family ammonium transporter